MIIFAEKNQRVKINGKAASYETVSKELIVPGELKAVRNFEAWDKT